MKNIKIKKSVPVCGEYDIIVAGGGVAGVSAAVSAARAGKKVLLIEKTISLGGLATIGLVNLFVPMCNGRGTKIIKGMAQELFDLAIKYGFDTVPEEWQSGNDTVKDAKTRYITRFSVPVFIMALTELIKNEGVDILFDTVITEPVTENGICKGLITENKSGSEFYAAKIIIDTTGDADILYRSGVPTVQGKNYHTFYTYGTDIEQCKKTVEKNDVAYLMKPYFGGTADLYGHNHPEGKPYWLGTNGRDVTNYVVENHIELLQKIKNDSRKERDIIQIPTMPQFRTTRRIDGNYTLLETDIYKHFDDSVGAICDFDRKDFLFEIPFGTLVKDGFPNLITAGRSASGEGYGWDVLRVIPPAIISGQAAGIAASISIDDNTPIYETDIKKLQHELEKQNVIIHFDDSLIPENLENSGEKYQMGHI